MKVNDTVRIVSDEHEELIGVLARIEKMGPDGTTAWLVKPGAKMGVWCALSHLEVVMCSMHPDQMLLWEDGGPQDITVHGRWFCPSCSESLMRALERDARAVSGEEPYEVLYSIDMDGDEIKYTAHYNLDMLEAAFAENEERK